MALDLGELVAGLRADDAAFVRGLNDAELAMAGFTRDTEGRLRDLNGSFASESQVMARILATNLSEGADEGMSGLRANAIRHLRQLRDSVDDESQNTFRNLVLRGEDEGDRAGRVTGMGLVRQFASTVRSSIGEAWTSGMSGLRSAVGSVQSSPWVSAAGTAAAIGFVATMLPLIGALLSGAVISVAGIGVIGLGAMLLKDEPAVKSAATKLVTTVKKIFTDAAGPLKKPFVDALNSFRETAETLAPQIKQLFQASAGFVKPLADGINALVTNALPGFVNMIQQGQPVFNALKQVMADIGVGLGSMFRQIGTGAPGAAIALQDVGKAIAAMLVTAGFIIGKLAQGYAAIRGFVDRVVAAFQWLSDVLVGHSIVPDMVNAIIAVFRSLPGRAVAAIASLGPRIAALATSAMQSLASRIRSGVSTAVSLVQSLPGRARSALGNLGGVLAGAGRSLIQGFINGIKGMLGSVRSAASAVVSAARDYFPFSPAKRGPFSGRGYTTYSGRALIGGFVKGIEAGIPAVDRTLASLATTPTAGQLAMAGAGAAGGAGGLGRAGLAQQQPVPVDLGGPLGDAIIEIIRDRVGIGGGDVQLYLGKRR